MKVHGTVVIVAAIVLGCCASAWAKKHTQKIDPLAQRSFNAPVESVYAAALSVAGREWQVTSKDEADHTFHFDTTNTKLENAGGYTTYSISVTCAAPPDGGTLVSLEVTEHASSQPSLMALMNKSERRKGVLQDFWDGVDAALKGSAAPQAAAPPNSPPQPPAPAVRAPSAPPLQAVPAPSAPRPVAPAASSQSTPAAGKPASSAGSSEPHAVPAPGNPKPSVAGEPATIRISSTPAGAEIMVEGKFFGDTPTTARLPGGEYTISIEKAGYKPWKRTLTLTEGGTVTLDATLEGSQ